MKKSYILCEHRLPLCRRTLDRFGLQTRTSITAQFATQLVPLSVSQSLQTEPVEYILILPASLNSKHDSSRLGHLDCPSQYKSLNLSKYLETLVCNMQGSLLFLLLGVLSAVNAVIFKDCGTYHASSSKCMHFSPFGI